MTRLVLALILGCSLTLLPRSARTQNASGRAPDESWTLRSGSVMYRLGMKDDQLVLDYFGPTSKAQSWSEGAEQRLRHDIAGLAEGRPIVPAALRVVARESRTHASGVEELRVTLRHVELPLDLEARYTAWGETGVITRQLMLLNRGARPLQIQSSPSVAWELPKGDYTLRYLWGGWGQERQLAIEKLGAGARRFDQTKGRSSNGYVPWLSLRNEDTGIEYLAELAWSGNWTMQVERQPGTGTSALRDQDVSVQLAARNDFGGPLILPAGDSVLLPRVAFTSAGDLDDASNQMRRFQREYIYPPSAANRPLLVQFNSWYPYQTNITVAELKRSADAAASLGAEVYILDSGWYSRRDWTKELGDYEVNRDKFPRGLEELADHVRSKGMRFGLWVEIENAGLESKLFREHPDWCLPYAGRPMTASDRCQLDFAKPEVRRWARATIDRLVRSYRLAWIKIDYNIDAGDRFDPGVGRPGSRLAAHIESYYAWLDELRAAYPDLIIENCSSGGLRFDIGIMAHAHTTWVSDNVDPVASLQLGYGCTRQFAPEVCNHWMVGDKDNGEVNPRADPGWWDFMFRAPMMGQFGISSRVTSWAPPLRDRAAANVRLYKRIRGTIAGADVYHLTPMPAPTRPAGWMATQFVAPGTTRSVLLAYRLAGGPAEQSFRLRGLAPDVTYEMSSEGTLLGRATGATLGTTGIRVALAGEWRAAVLEIEPRR